MSTLRLHTLRSSCDALQCKRMVNDDIKPHLRRQNNVGKGKTRKQRTLRVIEQLTLSFGITFVVRSNRWELFWWGYSFYLCTEIRATHCLFAWFFRANNIMVVCQGIDYIMPESLPYLHRNIQVLIQSPWVAQAEIKVSSFTEIQQNFPCFYDRGMSE